ncbi:MAG: family 1 glycosylhydrolase [Lawsonella sp.]|nr:glycoside hydrolase family 1 protein [Mycobacteriales bacterium]
MKLNSFVKKFVAAAASVAMLASGLVAGTTADAASVKHPWGKFRFGTATAGFQVEGSNYDSNWKRYVDRESPKDPEKVNPVKNATDFRHRYKEDIGNAAWMGLDTFRISIEWARIEPQKGKWNWKEIHYYDDVFRTMRKHGITPQISTVHYVYPGWVADQGGFLNEQTLKDYNRYVKFIANRWGKKTPVSWITFNEPLVFFGHEVEVGMVERVQMVDFMKKIVQAHKNAYDIIKGVNKKNQVGTNEAFLPLVTPIADQFLFVPVKNHLDFVGIDYYYGLSLDNLSAAYGATSSFSKIRPQPDGIYHAIKYFSEAFPGIPVYIIENGLPTYNGKREDGYKKKDWVYDTFFWIQRAVADGYPVIGYNYWSITDNYEWGQYNSRFGLYQVDVLKDGSLKRKPTTGVAAYRYVTHHGGVPKGYKPVADPAFCSLTRGLDSCINPPSVDGPLANLK